jgi:uncharacterized protein YktA (UPF0223 family)
MSKLVFLLEETLAKQVLDLILPKILPEDVLFQCVPYQGKSHLQKSIPRIIPGWCEPNVRFVVLHDKDSNDCKKLKIELKKLVSQRTDTLIRIVCSELESWFLGDLNAVEHAFNVNLSKKKNRRLYQMPDDIANAKQELKKLVPSYQQISGSQRIAKHLDIENNKSKSFQVFVDGIRKFCNYNQH